MGRSGRLHHEDYDNRAAPLRQPQVLGLTSESQTLVIEKTMQLASPETRRPTSHPIQEYCLAGSKA